MSNPATNHIEELADQLQRRFPDGHIELDPPSNSTGQWYLDVRFNSQNVIVSWQAKSGFGISCSAAHGYGEGADEVYDCLEAAYARVVSLLLSNEGTVPPKAVRLRDLRRMRGVSQEVLAATLDVRQATVSKLERRSDVLVSSLRATIQAMGGELRITASFPDGMERIVEIGNETPESP